MIYSWGFSSFFNMNALWISLRADRLSGASRLWIYKQELRDSELDTGYKSSFSHEDHNKRQTVWVGHDVWRARDVHSHLDTSWCRSVSSHRGHQLTSKLVSRLAQSCWGQSMSFMPLMQPTDWWEIKKSLSAYRAATLLLTPYIDSSQNVLYNARVCIHSVQFYWHNSHPKVLHTAR